ncbi:hypothetical protein [Roseateles sp.]|uniref:hypothetical protein n=1 Tax=Roseateles sp. TaxID=1971397 RepID=UPI002DFDB5E7|nr:hypothetical protein [Roseateles sp.]
MAADAEARIWAVIGASGTGKGLWTKQKLRELNPPRAVFWDFKNEYQEFTGERKHAKATATLGDIRKAMIKAGPDGPLRVRYAPRGSGEKALRREFEGLCELVYAWEHCVFVAEELANVTTPGWAPASWRKMTTSGRHAEVHIIGATQSPALVDKSFLGNCTLIHCNALREFAHRQAVARSMDIEEARLSKLLKFEYLEKDFDTGEVTMGKVEVPKKPRGAGP